MTCDVFLARYSDYVDDRLGRAHGAECALHVVECASCRRYCHVMERGRELLTQLPEPDPAHDFRYRLRHRLYNERERRTSYTRHVSGSTLFAMATIMAVLAWSPTLWSARSNSSPPGNALSDMYEPLPPAPVRTEQWDPQGPDPTLIRVRSGDVGLGTELWDDAHLLLYEYSPVARRYRTAESSSASPAPDS